MEDGEKGRGDIRKEGSVAPWAQKSRRPWGLSPSILQGGWKAGSDTHDALFILTNGSK